MVLSPPATRLNVEKATLDPILRAADRAEPKLRRAIASGLEAIRRAVPDFEDLIAAGNTGPVFAAIQELSVPPKLRAAIADATVTAAVAGAAADAAKFAVSFNDVNQRAVRWAERHAGTLITHVSPQTIAAVRDLVVVGVQNGVHPSITARTIRGVVPLTPRQAASVARLYQSSIEDGVSAAHASKIAARNAKRAQAYRATVIARTEALRSANMGQQLLWDTANDQGLISNATKVWMATEDSRTCPICGALDGTPVGLGDSFLVPSANPRRAGTTEKTPPAHPQCRCTMVLEYQKPPRA